MLLLLCPSSNTLQCVLLLRQSHKTAAPFRKAGWPLYDDAFLIYNKTGATGEHAHCPACSTTQSRPETPREGDNDGDDDAEDSKAEDSESDADDGHTSKANAQENSDNKEDSSKLQDNVQAPVLKKGVSAAGDDADADGSCDENDPGVVPMISSADKVCLPLLLPVSSHKSVLTK